MALISCPDCKSEVSDKAQMCIKCGYPINNLKNIEVKTPTAKKKPAAKKVAKSTSKKVAKPAAKKVAKPTSKWKWINLISILIVLTVFSLLIYKVWYDCKSHSSAWLPDDLAIFVNGGNINLMCFLLAGLVPTLFLRIIRKYIISTICIILFFVVGLLLKDLITIYEYFYPLAGMI